MPVTMLVSALTDVGRARTTNEDAFAVTDLASGKQIEARDTDHRVDVQDRGVLLALSDGMGGHQAGEVASALVLESLQAALAADAKLPISEQLEQAVQRANLSVVHAARSHDRKGMGATLTAVFVRGSEAFIAEVGDSRAYLLRGPRLRQITRDQSLVQLMVDHGVLSPEEARDSPSKNVILQAVGLSTDVRVAIARLALRQGDRFLLCSDGVSNAISDDELRELLSGSKPHDACKAMIELANERGGDDNQTAIVADLGGDGLEAPDEFETVTSTYEVLQAYEATFGGKPVSSQTAQRAADAAGITPRRVTQPSESDEVLPDLPSGRTRAPAGDDDPGATMKLTHSSRPLVLLFVIVGAIVLIGLYMAVR